VLKRHFQDSGNFWILCEVILNCQNKLDFPLQAKMVAGFTRIQAAMASRSLATSATKNEIIKAV